MKNIRGKKRILFRLMAIAGLTVSLFLCVCGALDVKEEKGAQDKSAAPGPATAGQVTTQASPIVTAKIKTDQNGRTFFNSDITTFVSQYNRYCKKGGASLLPDPGNWDIYSSENGIHTDRPVLNYTYSNEEAPDFYPTLRVSVSEDSGYIQEIAINYDDHDYREETFRVFENLCIYSLKSLRPEADSEQLSKLVKTVNNTEIPSGKEYERSVVPKVLYHKEGLGVYPYRRGWASMYFCIIPVTEERMQSFTKQGTELRDIS